MCAISSHCEFIFVYSFLPCLRLIFIVDFRVRQNLDKNLTLVDPDPGKAYTHAKKAKCNFCTVDTACLHRRVYLRKLQMTVASYSSLVPIACVASTSVDFSAFFRYFTFWPRQIKASAKKGRWGRGGEERQKKETLARKRNEFEKRPFSTQGWVNSSRDSLSMKQQITDHRMLQICLRQNKKTCST